jgi:hypothetical protein
MKRPAIGHGWPTRIWRLFWLLVLVGHAMLAAAWWWAQPGGFSALHPRFWSNRAAPVVVLALAISTLVALGFERMGALRILLPTWPAAWAAAGLASRVVFPITLASLWLVPEGAAAVMGLATFPVWRRGSNALWAAELASALGLALIGAALVFSQRVGPAATHPVDLAVPAITAGATAPTGTSGTLRLAGAVQVQTFDGTVTVRRSPVTITLQPLLTFLSKSPDGCPVVLVGSEDRAGPTPRLAAVRQISEQSCSLSYRFRGQGPATLLVSVDGDGRKVAVEARTLLEQPVFSHLNSFCDFEIRGHHRLSLAFSPCPDVLIEVKPSDYPLGRPARFAFLDHDGIFRVAEASSGEKGPFAILASGPLGPEQALSITLFDQDQPVGQITLADWSCQSDTTLSPTAGWGVPVNAIEFSLSGDSASSPASIFVTLAGTSVGRGWDCVAHAAGTYRNRVQIKAAGNPEPK